MNIKQYFQIRVGKTMNWSFEGGNGRKGLPYRRDYEVTIRGIENDHVLATVQSSDFDQSKRPIQKSSKELGIAKISLRGFSEPAHALEALVRKSDPTYFEGSQKAGPQPAPEADTELLERRIVNVLDIEKLGADENLPTAGSINRLRSFWSANPGLAAPELFSSKEGVVRGRWQDGASRTFWINFPEKGPLGWRASFPREGGYGLRQVNGRCNEEQDIIPVAALLGVRCTR